MRITLNFVLIFFLKTTLFAQISQNVELFANVQEADVRYSGSWSYIAPDNSEYALLGAKTATYFYAIDDPNNIIALDTIPGPETNWREITVIGHHAYVVTDVSGNNHSMQVIDLSPLPDSVHLVTSYSTTFTKGHIIQKDLDSEAPYVYVNGTSTTSGIHIIDVSDPKKPNEVGLYQPGYYIHDCHVRGDLLFAAAFFEGIIDVVDISDKTNPILVTSLEYGGSNTHSSSLTEDGKYLFIADEKNGNVARIWNIEDFDNPFEVAQYSADLETLVHNPYVRGDFVFIAHNTEGLRVLDIADPALPVEVGFYDTFEGPNGDPLGLWSACPYFPSGKIIGGDRHKGLFVWEFNNTRAGRFYGIAKDSFTNEIILNPEIILVEKSEILPVDLFGNFKFGDLENDYNLVINAAGYVQKTVPVSLSEGKNVNMEILLVPENLDVKIAGVVLDSLTMNPIENASIEIVENAETVFTESSGNFEYSLTAGDFTLQISADSFFSKNLNISLLPQDSLWLEIKLEKEPPNNVFDISKTKILKNYPNPFLDFTLIDLSEIGVGNEFILFNSDGKILRKTNLGKVDLFKFERGNLNSGVYFYLIKNKMKENIGGGKFIIGK